MSYRIHTTRPNGLTVEYVEDLVDFFDDDEMSDVDPALVIDDSGNMEAFVIEGDRKQLRAFALTLLQALRPTDEPFGDLDAVNGMWLTCGELIAHLAQFDSAMPITAVKPDGNDWLNVVAASDPRETGEPSVVLSTRDNFDTRQW